MKAKRRQIVVVEWDDSIESASWQSKANALAFHHGHAQEGRCLTVGVLVRRDAKAVTLAASINQQETHGGVWRIPAKVVKSYRVLATLKGSRW